MLQHALQSIINYLHLHPHAAGVIAYLIAFSESLAVVGTIIPGSVTMTGVGVLIGAGVIPAGSTITWAILGAFSGDYLSYWLGHHFKERLYNMWPFTRYPIWLDRGERFFERHGGKSVVIGRFFGPMRPMIPMIAGMLGLTRLRFLVAALPSAAAWAALYMLPGILIGALSLELPHGMAIQFILGTLLFLVILWGLGWSIRVIFKKVKEPIDHSVKECWNNLSRSPKLWRITQLLAVEQRPTCHRQLYLLFTMLLTGILFLIVMFSVITHNSLTELNYPIFHLLHSIRTSLGDDVMILITFLGDKKVVLPTAGFVFALLLARQHGRAAWHWFLLMFITAGSVFVFKHLVPSIRPAGLFNQATTGSFPSGHVALAITVWGFLAVLLTHDEYRDKKHIAYSIVALITVLVAFARLYLSAHWLTDVIGGVFLGLTCLQLIILSFRREISEHEPKSLLFATLGIFLIISATYGLFSFYTIKRNSTPAWPSYTTHLITWWQAKQPIPGIPLYRRNRLGTPTQAFNIQWLGSLESIKNSLSKQGWVAEESSLTLKGTAHRLATRPTKDPLPTLPQLYQNQVPSLLMTKVNHKGPDLILRLWPLKLTLSHTKNPLWIGIIDTYHPPHKILTLQTRV